MDFRDRRLEDRNKVLLHALRKMKAQSDGADCRNLATVENAVFDVEPISRAVPITRSRIVASSTAYSAMSWPSWLDRRSRMNGLINFLLIAHICLSVAPPCGGYPAGKRSSLPRPFWKQYTRCPCSTARISK